MDTSMLVTPIPARPDVWRALPAATRRAVTEAARQKSPAADVATATAAVEYGRHVRRRSTRIGIALAVAMVALLGAGELIGHALPSLPGQSIDQTTRDLVAGALFAGIAALIAVVEGDIGVSGLIGENLQIATAAGPDTSPFELRIGRRWPRRMELVELAVLCAGAITMPLLHNYLTTVALVIALGAYLWIGPAIIDPTSATMDADGITLPRWHVRVPWSSVRTVVLVDDRRVRVSINGPHEVTGRVPAHWRDRIAAHLTPGNAIKITSSEPELAVWVARGHLTRK